MTKNKVTIIGAGMVGGTTAFGLIASDIVECVALIDINKKLASSQVMDLDHSVPFWGYTDVKVGSEKDLADSRLVIITGGAAQKSGQTRIDLLKQNSQIIKEWLPKIFNKNPEAIIIIVTNPVDILTNIATKMYPKKKRQIFGSGTILDTARFRHLLGERMKVNPKSVHAYIIGEHGDSELPLWSTATVGSTPLDRFEKISPTEKKDIFEKAKNAAYAIIEGKQATYFAISAGLVKLAKTILYDKRTVYAVSHPLDGRYGIKNASLSLPAVIGASGIIKTVDVDMSWQEKSLLRRSARQLQKAEKLLD